MDRTCKIVLGLLLVAVGVMVASSVLVFGDGLSTRNPPSRLEGVIARTLRHWLIPASAARRENPVHPSETVLQQARAHFADHCASCHGNDGRGDTTLGRSLYPRAPDMRQRATQQLSDGELFWIIENGIRLTGMPGWSVPGHENETWGLVHFIRRLSRLTEQDLLEMEALNPRSAAEWKEREEEERFLRGDDAPGQLPAAGPMRQHHP